MGLVTSHDHENHNHKSSRDDRQNRRRDNERAGRDSTREERGENEEMYKTLRQSGLSNRFGDSRRPTKLLETLHRYISGVVDARQGSTLHTVEVLENNVVACPSIVISRVLEENGKVNLIHHAIMLVDFSKRPETRDGGFMEVDYEYPFTNAIAYDDRYTQEIEDLLEEKSTKEVDIQLSAGYTAIDVNSKKLDEKSMTDNNVNDYIDNLVFSVLSAIEAVRCVEEQDTSSDLTPDKLPRGSSIVADLSLQPSTSTRPDGTPVAEDFLIKVRESNPDRDRRDRRDERNNASLNRGDSYGSSDIGAVSGRIGFAYNAPAKARRGRNTEIGDNAAWIPDFLITNFDVQSYQPTVTLLSHMISTVGILGEEDAGYARWTAGFTPQLATGNRNIGALGREVVNPETDELFGCVVFGQTDTDNYYRFVDEVIVPNRFSVGLECGMHGPLTSITNYFVNAARYACGERDSNGNKIGEEDNQIIIEAWDSLTEGRFSQEWGTSRSVMAPEFHRIDIAHCVDQHQQLRDTAEIDVLHFLNLDDKNEASELSIQWADTFDTSGRVTDLFQLCAARVRMRRQMLNGNYTQTDTGYRVYFNQEAFTLLVELVGETRLAPQVRTSTTSTGPRRRSRVNTGRIVDSDRIRYDEFQDRGGRGGRANGYARAHHNSRHIRR